MAVAVEVVVVMQIIQVLLYQYMVWLQWAHGATHPGFRKECSEKCCRVSNSARKCVSREGVRPCTSPRADPR